MAAEAETVFSVTTREEFMAAVPRMAFIYAEFEGFMLQLDPQVVIARADVILGLGKVDVDDNTMYIGDRRPYGE